MQERGFAHPLRSMWWWEGGEGGLIKLAKVSFSGWKEEKKKKLIKPLEKNGRRIT